VDQEQSRVVPFILKKKVPYTILHGNGSVEGKYSVRAIPTFFLVDQKGIVRNKYEGFYPGMEKEWERDINALLVQPM